MRSYIGGRQISNRQEVVHKRGGLRLNNGLVLLVNAIIFIVIVILREDPLSTGILDVFFSKILYHSSLY